MSDSAIDAFVKMSTIKKDMATQNKSLAAQAEAAKGVIIKHMIDTNQKFLTISEGNYLVLKEKQSKPTVTAEFIRVVYAAYQQTLNRPCTEEEAGNFAKFMDTQQLRLSVPSTDLSMSHSKPVSAFF